jgi:hypothetical protein
LVKEQHFKCAQVSYSALKEAGLQEAIFLSIWELVGELMGLFEIVSIRVYGEEELERRLTIDTDIIL